MVPGLPRDPKTALATFNGMRNWLHAAGLLVVLVLTRRELAEIQQHARDAYAVRLCVVEVPFVPNATVDERSARTQLAHWLRERFGRLDLRGFVRSETEDVAWNIEDLYQDLQVTSVLVPSEGTPPLAVKAPRRVVEWLQASDASFFVMLGHPGSGKTFVLRWLALQMAGAPDRFGIDRPLRLVVSLAAYAESPGPVRLYDFLVEMLLADNQPAAHLLDRCVAERRAVFLLDGLDEVGNEAGSRLPCHPDQPDRRIQRDHPAGSPAWDVVAVRRPGDSRMVEPLVRNVRGGAERRFTPRSDARTGRRDSIGQRRAVTPTRPRTGTHAVAAHGAGHCPSRRGSPS